VKGWKTTHWVIACGSVWLALASGCGDDAIEPETPCPEDVDEGDTVPCSCGDAQSGTQTCRAVGTLSECDCSGGAADSGAAGADSDGGAGRGGRGGTAGSDGGAMDGSAGSGGSGEPEEDAGMEPMTDAGGAGDAGDAGGEMPAGMPPTDGSQLAECTDSDECTEGRVCYQTGPQVGNGYCTEPCDEDMDCEDLGELYTCNAMDNGGGGGGGMDGECRIVCEDADDTSCPELMSCVEVGGDEFRCVYPPQDPGAQDAALWAACSNNGDCVEGLVCYGTVGGGGGGPPGQGGGDNGSFCTQPCEEQADCTEAAPSGDLEPTCGTSACRFDCSEGGTCPDGMECVSLGGGGGGGTARCLYSE